MTITESTTVAELAATVPSSVRVLQRHGIDFCCGGKRPIGDVCREKGLSFGDISAAIDASARREHGQRDWSREPLHALIDHIIATYHDRLREDLPRFEAMAGKATLAHASKAPHLARVQDLVGELSADLNDHMRKEELVLFPAIRTLEGAGRRGASWISQPITVMEQEHDRAGELLAELRSITNHYTVPDWACPTVRALYRGLEEMEASMHLHVHLENNILFPRTLALA